MHRVNAAHDLDKEHLARRSREVTGKVRTVPSNPESPAQKHTTRVTKYICICVSCARWRSMRHGTHLECTRTPAVDAWVNCQGGLQCRLLFCRRLAYTTVELDMLDLRVRRGLLVIVVYAHPGNSEERTPLRRAKARIITAVLTECGRQDSSSLAVI
jgi:hypothetical protein